ncbi:DUF3572 domain-containing protein [Sphingomonas sp. FW199]|uniref:DUF3572 domain-containing protein n=1 Tax=Sphingomonas sp. FW199 TaxID=3400217 RepID=UPI003CEEC23C
MLPPETNPASDSSIIALHALAWVLGDSGRATRFVDLTGLDPETIRARAGDPVLLAAVIDHLCAHEPDLLACADAIHQSPDALVRAGRDLKSA